MLIKTGFCLTMMHRPGLSQLLTAYRLIATLPLLTAKPAAFVAQEFYFLFLFLRQGFQLIEGFVQAKIRHHIPKLRPVNFLYQSGKIRQHLGGG